MVEFDYDAEQEDELTIKVGDVIKNVQMSEGGWWEGELNGKKGMFPDNFVKVGFFLIFISTFKGDNSTHLTSLCCQHRLKRKVFKFHLLF